MSKAAASIPSDGPLVDLDEWEEFLEGRYKEGNSEE